MCKWWWKLEHDTGPWQDFMRLKYLRGKGIYYAKKDLETLLFGLT
jgi:hypothetical protein